MADSQRENINNQKEYNDLLSITTSLIGSINKSMSTLQDQSDKRNKSLSNEVDMTKEILENLEDERDIDEVINKLKNQTVSISEKNLGVNEGMKDLLLNQVDAVGEVLMLQQAATRESEILAEGFDRVTESVIGSLNGITQMVDSVPILGDLVNGLLQPMIGKMTETISRIAPILRNNFVDGFGEARVASGSFFGGVRGGLSSMGSAWVRIAPLIMNPWGLAAAAALSLFAIGLAGFYQIQQSAEAFRMETGLLANDTEEISDNIQSVVGDTASLGAGFEDVQNAAVAFTQTFDNIDQASASVLKSMTVLNKNFGVSLETSAKVNKIFSSMSGTSSETAQNMVQMVTDAADLVGIAPQKVLEDIAENSEVAFQFFGGSVSELASAAVEAERLGSSLGEMASLSENLLDFESSINKELEASALLGQRINLNRARSLAFEGDIAGAQEETLRQLDRIGDLTQLNRFEQQAIVDLTGQELSSLVRQQQIRSRFGELEENQLAIVQQRLAAGEKIGEITQEELDREAELLSQRQEVANLFTRLGNQLSALGIGLINVLAPFAEAVLMPIVNAFEQMGEDFRDFGSIFSDAGADGEFFMEILKGLGATIGWLIGVIGTLTSGSLMVLVDVLEGVMGLVMGLGQMLGGIFIGDTSMFIKGLETIGNTLVDFFYSLGARVINAVMSPLKDTRLGEWLGDSWFNVDPDATVDDGIIQNGKVISTNPADTLIATKNPTEFSQDMGGSGNGQLLQEIKGLREDLRSGKVAVYIDGKKATSAISNVVDKIGSNSYAL